MTSHDPVKNVGRIFNLKRGADNTGMELFRWLPVILALIAISIFPGCFPESEECVENVGWGTEGKYYYYTGECTAVVPAPKGASPDTPIYEFTVHFDDSFLSHINSAEKPGSDQK